MQIGYYTFKDKTLAFALPEQQDQMDKSHDPSYITMGSIWPNETNAEHTEKYNRLKCLIKS